MKVICINGVLAGDKSKRGTRTATKDWEIYQLEIYTICRDEINKYGEDVVTLMEKPDHVWYLKCRFIPISDIDETSLYEKVFINDFNPCGVKNI